MIGRIFGWVTKAALTNPYVIGIAAAAIVGLIASGVIWYRVQIYQAEQRGKKEERQICEMEKFQSKRDAEDVDHVLQQETAKRQEFELDRERERTLAAQEKAREHERTIVELTPELQACRVATDADLDRLR